MNLWSFFIFFSSSRLMLVDDSWMEKKNYENYHSLRHIFQWFIGIFLKSANITWCFRPRNKWEKKCWNETTSSNCETWEQEAFDNFSFHLLREKINLRKLNFLRRCERASEGRKKNRNKLLRGTIMNFNVINERLKWLISVKRHIINFNENARLVDYLKYVEKSNQHSE